MANSGWTNDSITTLVVPTGATTGERIVIDGVTGTIQVYDANNNLIATMSPVDQTINGVSVPHGFGSYEYTLGTQSVILNESSLSFTDTRINSSLASRSKIVPFNSSDAGTYYPGVAIASGSVTGWNSAADVILISGDPVISGQSAVALTQGTTGSTIVTGQAIQTDTDPTATNTRQPWRRHTEKYTGTVSGAAGQVTFTHNAAFTPSAGQFTPLTGFTQGTWDNTFGTGGFNGIGQARLVAYTPAGAFVANGVTVTFYAEFSGIG